MANKGKIDEWIDEPAVRRQYETFIGLIEDLNDRISAFKKAEIKLADAKSITDTTAAIRDLGAEQQKLTETEKQLHNQHEKLVQDAKNIITNAAGTDRILKQMGGTLDQNIRLQISNKAAIGEWAVQLINLNEKLSEGRISQAKYAEALAKITEEQERLKIANAELTQSIKATIKEDQAAAGSIDQRTQRLGRLKDLYRQLSDEERDNVEVGGALLQVIQEEDTQLKALNGSLGNFQGNVGNYPKLTLNFSTALDILKGELAAVTSTLEKYKAAGNADAATIAQLVKQQEILNVLVNNAASGYASATQELRSNEKALQALAAAGLQNEEAYKQLLAVTSELKDNVGDLKQELKAKASDTSFFDGLISGAQGIVGAYSAAQGATALFGVENKDLEKTFVKLQAAMAILQGLQAVQNALQKESAARILITTGLEKGRLLITNLQTAAESRSIVVRYAAIAAQKLLNAVMTVHPIIAIVGALALLLISVKAYASGTADATKAQKEFNDALEFTIKLTDDAAGAIDKANQISIASMEAQGAAAKQLRDQNLKSIQDQINEYQRLETGTRKAYDAATDKLKELRKNRESADSEEVDGLIKTRQQFEDIQRKKFDLQQKLDLEIQRNALETRKEEEAAQRNILELQKSKVATTLDANNRIAESDRYTADARIAAVRRSELQQVNQIKLSKAQQLTDITLTADARAVVEQKAQEEIVKVQRDANEKIRQLQEQRKEIQRSTGFEFNKRNLEAEIAGFEEVANSERATTAQRLTALSEAQVKRQQIIEGTKNFELKNDLILAEEQKKGRKLTDDEILAITQQTAEQRLNIQDGADKELNKALEDYYKAKGEIIKTGSDKELAQLQVNQESAQNVLNKQRDEELAILDDRYSQGLVKQKDYDAQRKAIEDRFQQASLLNELNFTEQIIKLLKDRGADTTEAEAKLAAARAAIYKQDTDNHKEATDKKEEQEKQYRDKAIDLAKEVSNTITSFYTASIERQKNQIQDQIDLIDQRREADIAAITASSLAEDEKAHKTAVINAQADAQKQALERRQRELDQQKARFDRGKTIFDIIANTAAAVVEALPNIPLSVIVGAIGAAQLAAVLAQPIPKYADGRTDGPAEWAYVGDGGIHEVVEHQGRAWVTPDTDTLTYLPAHAKVHASVEDYLGTKWNVRHNLPAEDSSVMGQAALLTQLSKSQEKQTNRLLNGIERNKSTVNVIYTWDGVRVSRENAAGFTNYLNKNIKGI